eukprot:COSAG02_NODE_2739_length_8128_cov_8.386100_3_plen_502_part_00
MAARQASPQSTATYVARTSQRSTCAWYGANVNWARIHWRRVTLLHVAVKHAKADMVTFLLNRGANVNLADISGLTSLHVAVTEHAKAEIDTNEDIVTKDIVTLLLDRGANVNLGDEDGLTPLHLAVAMDKPNMVALLLDRGANVNATDINGITPLELWREHTDILGEDIQGRRHRWMHCYVGQTPLLGRMLEERQKEDKADHVLNQTDLDSKTTSLSWYDDTEVSTVTSEPQPEIPASPVRQLRRSKREKVPIRESVLGLATRLERGKFVSPIFKIREQGDVNNAELLRIINALGVNRTVQAAYLQNPTSADTVDDEIMVALVETLKQRRIWALNIGEWHSKTDGKLDDSQIETLERLGMHWSRRDTTFDANIAALEAFVASHGHANATKKDGALGDFVSKQRTYKRNLDAGKQSPLTQDRIARLDAIDFCWDPAEADWQKQAERLRAHYAAGEEWGSMGKSLKAWVSKQRRNKRALDVGGKTTMSPSRVAILERIGLRWD